MWRVQFQYHESHPDDWDTCSIEFETEEEALVYLVKRAMENQDFRRRVVKLEVPDVGG
jgi:hypothetical protein